MQLSWKMFETQCMDSRGVQLKFESLCRQLFIYDILSGNHKNLYLHSNPNNPGIETEPILDEVNNRLVGFQAKYFDSRVDYNEILSSAKKTVEYYAGKVDHVYLFCNKPLKTITISNTSYILGMSSLFWKWETKIFYYLF